MPLRDHFRPPLDDLRHWEGLHATWPVMMVAQLRRSLPTPYFAEPRVHPASSAEIDVATFERENGPGRGNGHGGVATATWAPPQPTFAVATDLPSQGVYEVRVYDERRLVAAIEIVSPANKDRPEHRRAFVAKRAGLLREQVSVVIVDIVTTRTQDLYGEVLDLMGHADPNRAFETPPYAAACRVKSNDNDWLLETWTHSLQLAQPLPTVPVWLADDLAVPLELEECYEQSCNILAIA